MRTDHIRQEIVPEPHSSLTITQLKFLFRNRVPPKPYNFVYSTNYRLSTGSHLSIVPNAPFFSTPQYTSSIAQKEVNA